MNRRERKWKERYAAFLRLVLQEGTVWKPVDLERLLDCSRSVLRSLRAQANRDFAARGLGKTLVYKFVDLKGGVKAWCYFVTSDYEQALPSLEHLRAVAIGSLKAELAIEKALLSGGTQSAEEMDTLHTLVGEVEEALEVLSV